MFTFDKIYIYCYSRECATCRDENDVWCEVEGWNILRGTKAWAM